jgi:acetyl esterase
VNALDLEVRDLLDRWAASSARPVRELTAEAVRADDLAVLDLQRAPGELYSVEDVEAPGPPGSLPVRVYRPRPGRHIRCRYLHGGGFVIGPRRL